MLSKWENNPGLPSRWVITRPLSFSISLLRKRNLTTDKLAWQVNGIVFSFPGAELHPIEVVTCYCVSESGKGIIEASYCQHAAISWTNLQLNKDSHIVRGIKDLEGDFQAATATRCDL